MSNPSWGLKRICPNCATRYYDFAKNPPKCPSCGTAYDPEALLKSRKSRTGAAEEAPTRKTAKADVPVLDVDKELPDALETEDDVEDLEEGEAVVVPDDDTLIEDDLADDSLEDVEVADEGEET